MGSGASVGSEGQGDMVPRVGVSQVAGCRILDVLGFSEKSLCHMMLQ